MVNYLKNSDQTTSVMRNQKLCRLVCKVETLKCRNSYQCTEKRLPSQLLLCAAWQYFGSLAMDQGPAGNCSCQRRILCPQTSQPGPQAWLQLGDVITCPLQVIPAPSGED